MDKQALVQGADRIVPDSGAPRFIEALNEAAARVDKEKGNYFPVVVILGSTTADGSSFVERDVQRMLQRFAERSTVHVIMLSTARSRPVRNRAGQSDRRWRARWPRRPGGRYDNIAAIYPRWPPCCPKSVHRSPRATPVRAVSSGSHFSDPTASRARSGRSASPPARGGRRH